MGETYVNTIEAGPRIDRTVYYRLIALWVLNEAMFGGIIHGFRIPVSGLVVGSCAVICICLIAWYVPSKGAIIKATIIVAIFKMMLSPQAPPTAYIAVFFQGLMGELLFYNRRFFRLSCILLATLALLESGLQRILVATIVYGSDIWKAINDFLNGLSPQKATTNYSLLIGGGYVVLHLITGLFIGWWCSQLPGKIAAWARQQENKIVISNDTAETVSLPTKKRRGLRIGLLIVWIALVLLYVQSYFNIGNPLLPPYISLKILLRSIIIVCAWYFMVGPLLKRMLYSWLQRRQTKSRQEIQQVLELLPSTQHLIAKSWEHSAGRNIWQRIAACTKKILVNALNPILAGKVYIFTGPIQSGKTTSLVKWSENKDDVFGILTPVVNGKRTFMNVHARHLFDMEATAGENNQLKIGRFVFSKASFDKAIQVIRSARNKTGWLVVDEIGPMELRGDGFREVLKEILAWSNERQKIILVVREGLEDKVRESFQLGDAVMINKVSDIV